MTLTALGIQGKPYLDGEIQAYIKKYIPIALDCNGVWKALVDDRWEDYHEQEEDEFDKFYGNGNPFESGRNSNNYQQFCKPIVAVALKFKVLEWDTEKYDYFRQIEDDVPCT
jgi:hypothetical protein